MFVTSCPGVPGSTRVGMLRDPCYTRRGVSISHFECDVQTFLLKILKKANFRQSKK